VSDFSDILLIDKVYIIGGKIKKIQRQKGKIIKGAGWGAVGEVKR
jgi:hypothetical protein